MYFVNYLEIGPESKEEKKILQGWGVKGAATTILAMFGIANF